MIDNNILKELLQEKKSLFFKVENITESMCTIDVDELENCTTERGKALDEIAALDNKIKASCDSNTELISAINHTCDRGGLSSELACFYDAALQIKASINRILKNDVIVLQRIETEKSSLLEKIEELNQSGHSVAQKYHQSVRAGINSRFDFENELIV